MSAPVVVEGELTVFTVHAIKERLMAALAIDSALRIDLGGVSEVDGAGVQLLLAVRRELRQRDARLTLIAPPAQVVEALALIDLAGEFAELIIPETEPVA